MVNTKRRPRFKITPELIEQYVIYKDKVALFRQWLGSRRFCYLSADTLIALEDLGINTDWVWMLPELQPSQQLETIACTEPSWAYGYALHVVKKPTNLSRAAACRDPGCAYLYARDVDKRASLDTRHGTAADPAWKDLYEERFGLER